MSRIGNKPIPVPQGIEIKIEPDKISVKGPQGELRQSLPSYLKIEEKEGQLEVSVENPQDNQQRAMWGTVARLVFNMIKGVKEGFEKKLQLVGVGYKAQVRGNNLVLEVGFSHPVEFPIPKGIVMKAEKESVTISGPDKQQVGEVTDRIRKIRPPEPYKGKGIKYKGEEIKRKTSKKAAVLAGGTKE